MALASNPANIRYNGTGRAAVAAVGGSTLDRLGEMDKLSFSCKVETEELKTTQNASRGTIVQAEKSRDATLSFGLLEMNEENLKIALLGSDWNTSNQAAGVVDAVTKTWTLNKDIILGFFDVFSTKLSHGTVTNGPFAVGDSITGGTSSATGKIAYVGSGYIEVVNVSGTFVVAETITATTKTATLTGVEVQDDVVLTDSTGATRRVLGTDYQLDPEPGWIRPITANVVANDELSFDYPALNRKYMYGMAAGSVERKLIFISDEGDLGPRTQWTFHKVKINLNGDFPLIGEGAQVLQITGTVLFDSTQPSGQEYYRIDQLG